MKILLWGDMHYPDASARNGSIFREIRDHYFKLLFDAYFGIEADLYIQLGDLCNLGSVEEFTSIWPLISSYQKNFYFVYGNHDKYLATDAMIRDYTGQDALVTLNLGGLNILFLNTSAELEPARWGGYLDEKQLQRLADSVTKTEGSDLLICSHHGIFDTTFRTNHKMHYLEPREEIQDILRSRKTPAFFLSAHNHMDSIFQEGPWTFIQLPATFDDPSPRLLTFVDEVDGAEGVQVAEGADGACAAAAADGADSAREACVTLEAITLTNEETLRGLSRLLTKNLDHFTPNKIAVGTSRNRNGVFRRYVK